MTETKRDSEKDQGPIIPPGEVVLDHDYDGIKELDNSLPSWWLIGFYITIIFSIGYVAYYHFSDGPSLQEQVRLELQNIEATFFKAQKTAEFDPKKLAALFKTPGAVEKGKGMFQARCVSCHGNSGQGGIGPNLTDDYWINSDGRILGIAKTIRDGVLAKGMPNWGAVLSDDELSHLAVFVRSIRGSNPAGAKAPQGNLVKPTPDP